jgi:hypothetical protein
MVAEAELLADIAHDRRYSGRAPAAEHHALVAVKCDPQQFGDRSPGSWLHALGPAGDYRYAVCAF